MGVPSLNDLAVDGTLNTTYQPTKYGTPAIEQASRAYGIGYITVYTYIFYAFPIGSPSRVTDSGDGNYRTFCFSGFRLEAIL